MFKTIRRIHEDERGLETLQVVMIIAIAAIFLALIKYFWDDGNGGGIKGWAKGLVTAVTGANFNN
jgi:hypothetical protein